MFSTRPYRPISTAWKPPYENSCVGRGSGYRMNHTGIAAADQTKLTIHFAMTRVKFGATQSIFGVAAGGKTFFCSLQSDDTLFVGGGGGDIGGKWISTRKFRDVHAYPVTIQYDAGNATAEDRLKVFIGRAQETEFNTGNHAVVTLNNTNPMMFSGANNYWFSASGGGFPFEGLLHNVHFMPGQIVSPSEFLEDVSKVGRDIEAIKKSSSLSYAEGGFHCTFGNSGNLGENSEGVTDLTVAGMTSDDQIISVPGDPFPVMNALNTQSTNIISNGGLTSTYSGGSVTSSGMVTMPFPQTGAWYYEHTCDIVGGDFRVGIAPPQAMSKSGVNIIPGSAAGQFTYRHTGVKDLNNVQSAYGASYSAGHTIGILYDGDAGTIEFFDDTGASQGVISGLSGEYAAIWNTYVGGKATLNFGQRSFKHMQPAGSNVLRASNLPTPSAPADPDTGSFTGNAATDGSYVHLGYAPSYDDALTINGNAVTWGTHADPTASGFKLRASSSSYNSSGTNTYSLVTANAEYGGGDAPYPLAK